MKEPTISLLADELEDLKENGPKQFYGVITGTVVDVADPLLLGRVRVRVPSIDGLEPLPWARIAVPMAGFGAVLPHGTYFIPQLGTEVLVAFENGDVGKPYVIGSLWHALARPPLPSPLAQISAIRTLTGSQIVFSELPIPTITIQAGPTPPVPIPAPATPVSPPPTIMLSSVGITIMAPTGIQLVVGNNVIAITPAGIVMQSGASGITLSAAGILIQGTPQVQINPAG